MTTFKKLGLNDNILKSLDDLGFIEPSPIQEKSIPFILSSKDDLIALAQTGTGKTAAFCLPILNQIEGLKGELRAIILCPTRELCLQIFQDINKLAKHSDNVRTLAVYGGERIDTQIRTLRKGVDIVVGTPGRVHDLINRGVLNLKSIDWLVLDEADEMLDMGFKKDLDAILDQTPKSRQTLLFSATMSKSVRSLAEKYMYNAKEISAGEKNIGADNVFHEYYVVQGRNKFTALKRILDSLPGIYGILFCRTRREVEDLTQKLKGGGYNAEAIHGEISQKARTQIMDSFKKKQISLLIATDVAARGIDVNDLSHVINYSIPDQNEVYTHRSGRTGRAQKSGICISLIGQKDLRKIKQIERTIRKNIAYKEIPSMEDVRKKQMDELVKEIQNADIEKIKEKKHFEDINSSLKKLSKEELINYIISLKTAFFEEEKEINLKNDFQDRKIEQEASLRINLGKRHGFDIKSLFGLINASRKLKGIEIGRISLMPEYSFFTVERDVAGDVISELSGKNFKGRSIRVAEAQGKPSFFARRKNTRGFKRKRR